MKIHVVHDAAGRILSLFDPAAQGDKRGSLKYNPSPGEHVVELELPKEHTETSFLDLPRILRVHTSGAKPVLEHLSKPTQ